MLQYYLGIEKPERLSDEKWAEKIAVLKRIREMEAKKTKDNEAL